MIRKCCFALAGLALALAAGCGSLMIGAMQGQPVWLTHRLDWTVYQPSHRVALATYEALKAELDEVKVVDIELTQDDHFNPPGGGMPRLGDLKIPDDYPAFWADGLNPNGPVLVNCRSCDFAGKTKDGRKVEAVVRLEIMGSDQRTVVSVQVGRKRDDKASKALIDKISERVHNQPILKPGSPEERAALNKAFGPGPGKDMPKFDASVKEYRIHENN